MRNYPRLVLTIVFQIKIAIPLFISSDSVLASVLVSCNWLVKYAAGRWVCTNIIGSRAALQQVDVACLCFVDLLKKFFSSLPLCSIRLLCGDGMFPGLRMFCLRYTFNFDQINITGGISASVLVLPVLSHPNPHPLCHVSELYSFWPAAKPSWAREPGLLVVWPLPLKLPSTYLVTNLVSPSNSHQLRVSSHFECLYTLLYLGSIVPCFIAI